MPPRKHKKPKVHDLQSSSTTGPGQTYIVRATGSRQTTSVKELASSKKANRDYAKNPPESDLLYINQAIAEDWVEQLSHIGPSAGSEEGTPEITAELEALMDDAHLGSSPHSSHGKGQNEMLQQWKTQWGSTYLAELYQNHAPPGSVCMSCNTATSADYRCNDCVCDLDLCQSCLLSQHRSNPTHRVRWWTGAAWTKTSLREEGLVLALGNHTATCPLGERRDFILGDLTGMHEVSVAFCRCFDHAEDNQQLLRSSIIPCSDDRPVTGFTFAVLRNYYFLSSEGKISASRFYSALQRSTNNMQPHRHVNRFREFLRAVRMWSHLQDLKRSGAASTEYISNYSLAIRCPACPRVGVNHEVDDVIPSQEFLYTQQISYDGSFQLVRKNKASDEHDLCLSDGTKYWVKQDAYQQHLIANKDTAYNQSTRGTDCNNHRAANDTWTRRTGVAESGVGAVTCARHTFYMPGGVVNYYKGERFAYTDFAILSVLQLLFTEAAIRVGIFYDIYCHWIKTFWTRLANIAMFGVFIDRLKIFGGVGKYHIAGHTDSCYARYSPNNMQGIGRMDAEGCERAWADMNQAARSSAEKGPGFRIESLNDCMHDWNWRKLIGMIALLLTKYWEAVRMANETESEWQEYNELIDELLVEEWKKASIEPEQVGNSNTYTSVFLSKEGSQTSMTRALLELNTLEAQESQTSSDVAALTAPSWISEGIEIEHQQKRLMRDIKSYGSKMTDRQALDCFNRRSQLSTRIIRHREHAAHFIDVIPTSLDSLPSLAEETDGRPEKASLYLPSQLKTAMDDTARSVRVKGIEYKLRRVACLRAIHRFKVAAIQKRTLLRGKKLNARGEIMNTRAQTVINRTSAQVNMAIWEYNNSYKAMESIGLTETDNRLLKPLDDADHKVMSDFLDGGRGLGEGYKRTPWFWCVGGDGTQEEKEVNDEINEGALS
ncbi:hypothetical protein RhiJN_24956 [Ceratobasidium sp. AG-Ba]|nr:hypothetical protein RhiJN_24956 [Ceratobasidium sp. AG-Ba]